MMRRPRETRTPPPPPPPPAASAPPPPAPPPSPLLLLLLLLLLLHLLLLPSFSTFSFSFLSSAANNTARLHARTHLAVVALSVRLRDVSLSSRSAPAPRARVCHTAAAAYTRNARRHRRIDGHFHRGGVSSSLRAASAATPRHPANAARLRLASALRPLSSPPPPPPPPRLRPLASVAAFARARSASDASRSAPIIFSSRRRASAASFAATASASSRVAFAFAASAAAAAAELLLLLGVAGTPFRLRGCQFASQLLAAHASASTSNRSGGDRFAKSTGTRDVGRVRRDGGEAVVVVAVQIAVRVAARVPRGSPHGRDRAWRRRCRAILARRGRTPRRRTPREGTDVGVASRARRWGRGSGDGAEDASSRRRGRVRRRRARPRGRRRRSRGRVFQRPVVSRRPGGCGAGAAAARGPSSRIALASRSTSAAREARGGVRRVRARAKRTLAGGDARRARRRIRPPRARSEARRSRVGPSRRGRNDDGRAPVCRSRGPRVRSRRGARATRAREPARRQKVPRRRTRGVHPRRLRGGVPRRPGARPRALRARHFQTRVSATPVRRPGRERTSGDEEHPRVRGREGGQPQCRRG